MWIHHCEYNCVVLSSFRQTNQLTKMVGLSQNKTDNVQKPEKFLNAIWIPVLFPNFWVVSIDFFLVSFMPFSYNWVYKRRSSQLRLLFWCFRMSNDKSEHSTTRNISSVLRWHSKPVTHILPAYNGDLKNRLVWHSACVRLSYGLLFKCCI